MHPTREIVEGDWKFVRDPQTHTWIVTHQETGDTHHTGAHTFPDARQYLIDHETPRTEFRYTVTARGSRARAGHQRYSTNFLNTQ